MRHSALLAAFVILIFLSIVSYGIFLEPRNLSANYIHLGAGPLARTLAGRKIALISDLHFGSDGAPADALGGLLREIRPDLIILAGDYVEWGSRGEAYERAFDFLARLNAPLGMYAVLGDADRNFSRKSCEFCHLAGSGAPTDRHRVIFLRNEARVIDLPHGQLRIGGLDMDLSRPTRSLVNGLLTGDTPTILISHSSAVYKYVDTAKDVLTLSGDTHGGQMWLPRWVWRFARFKPDSEHIRGYFQDGHKALFVTRGVGTSHVRFRLGAPPEIVVLEFSRGAR